MNDTAIAQHETGDDHRSAEEQEGYLSEQESYILEQQTAMAAQERAYTTQQWAYPATSVSVTYPNV
jgi:hypothetical protein